MALLATGAQASAQEGSIMGPYPGTQKIAGPALLCGEAFALRLAAGEEVQKQEGPDFILYYAEAADGPFLIYEGNFPQPHDDEIRTGGAFPAVIAIHDNRSSEAKSHSRIRDRLVTGDALAQACPKLGGGA
jgi:hypothetical protein